MSYSIDVAAARALATKAHEGQIDTLKTVGVYLK